MSKIKICFRAVICYKYFAVLDRIHCSRINIDIGIKFLHSDCIAARFEQTAEGCCGDSFAQSGHNAAGDKYVLYGHNKFLLMFTSFQ